MDSMRAVSQATVHEHAHEPNDVSLANLFVSACLLQAETTSFRKFVAFHIRKLSTQHGRKLFASVFAYYPVQVW